MEERDCEEHEYGEGNGRKNTWKRKGRSFTDGKVGIGYHENSDSGN